MSHEAFQKADKILIYLSKDGEVGTDNLLGRAFELGETGLAFRWWIGRVMSSAFQNYPAPISVSGWDPLGFVNRKRKI